MSIVKKITAALLVGCFSFAFTACQDHHDHKHNNPPAKDKPADKEGPTAPRQG